MKYFKCGTKEHRSHDCKRRRLEEAYKALDEEMDDLILCAIIGDVSKIMQNKMKNLMLLMYIYFL